MVEEKNVNWETNYDELYMKLSEDLNGLIISDYITRDDYYEYLDDFEKWAKTANPGDVYYACGFEYKLEEASEFMSLRKIKQTISEAKEMYKERLIEILKEINCWDVDVFYQGEKGELGIYDFDNYPAVFFCPALKNKSSRLLSFTDDETLLKAMIESAIKTTDEMVDLVVQFVEKVPGAKTSVDNYLVKITLPDEYKPFESFIIDGSKCIEDIEFYIGRFYWDDEKTIKQEFYKYMTEHPDVLISLNTYSEGRLNFVKFIEKLKNHVS